MRRYTLNPFIILCASLVLILGGIAIGGWKGFCFAVIGVLIKNFVVFRCAATPPL